MKEISHFHYDQEIYIVVGSTEAGHHGIDTCLEDLASHHRTKLVVNNFHTVYLDLVPGSKDKLQFQLHNPEDAQLLKTVTNHTRIYFFSHGINNNPERITGLGNWGENKQRLIQHYKERASADSLPEMLPRVSTGRISIRHFAHFLAKHCPDPSLRAVGLDKELKVSLLTCYAGRMTEKGYTLAETLHAELKKNMINATVIGRKGPANLKTPFSEDRSDMASYDVKTTLETDDYDAKGIFKVMITSRGMDRMIYEEEEFNIIRFIKSEISFFLNLLETLFRKNSKPVPSSFAKLSEELFLIKEDVMSKSYELKENAYRDHDAFIRTRHTIIRLDIPRFNACIDRLQPYLKAVADEYEVVKSTLPAEQAAHGNDYIRELISRGKYKIDESK